MTLQAVEKNHRKRLNAWLDMAPAARPMAREMRLLKIDMSTISFMAHWEIGVRVNAVRGNPKRYGANGLKLLRSFFRRFGPRLDDDALVASNFDRVTVEKLAMREMRNGRHLSWNHMTLLAGVAAGTLRDQLIETSFRQALTVAELKSLISSIEPVDSGKAPNANG